jgi:hypothetical protein
LFNEKCKDTKKAPAGQNIGSKIKKPKNTQSPIGAKYYWDLYFAPMGLCGLTFRPAGTLGNVSTYKHIER